MQQLSDIADHVSDEVFHCRSWGVILNGSVLDELVQVASANPRKRARLCMHPRAEDIEQQMLIVLCAGAYDVPHLHESKRETMVPVRGLARYHLYAEDGTPERSLLLGEGNNLYISSPLNTYHSLEVLTPAFTFWEFAHGPFTPQSTTRATWARA